MKLKRLGGEWSVCKLSSAVGLDWNAPYLFVGKTDKELSVVCPSKLCETLDCENREDGWNGFRIEGTLDFSLIGILAEISAILAGEAIGIFVVSTFETDYVWVKKERWKDAVAALQKNGYPF